MAELVGTGGLYEKGGAYIAVAQRRFDFTVMDAKGNVVLVVEYDGPDHDKRSAAKSDAVKDVALERLGIPFLRLSYADDEAAHREAVRALFVSIAPDQSARTA